MGNETHDDPFAGPDGAALRDFVDWMTSQRAVHAILLVGSRARQQHVVDSDYDLLIIRASNVPPSQRPHSELLPAPRHQLRFDTIDWPDVLLAEAIGNAIKLAPELGRAFWNTSDGHLVMHIMSGIVLFGHSYIEHCRRRCAGLAESAQAQTRLDLTPDVRDGLNIVQRRLLYVLHLMQVRTYRKSARVIEECYSRLQPFASSLTYYLLVRMAQPWRARYPLIDGQGNFGCREHDSAASMRYTEVKMAPLAMEWLEELAHGGTEFSELHGESPGEPVVLPVSLPQLLLNGAQDFRSDGPLLPPYNLGEVCDAVLALLDDPALPQEHLHRIVPGPDFPTGGVLERAGIRETLETGRGTLTLRGRVEVQQRANHIALVITDLPSGSPTPLTEELAELMRSTERTLISDVLDMSDSLGIKHEVQLRPGASIERALAVLASLGSFQRTLPIEHKALIAGCVRVVPLRRLLEEFIAFRKALLRRRAQLTATRLGERVAELDAILWAAVNAAEFSALLSDSATGDEALQRLRQHQAWTDSQADAAIREALAATIPENRRRLEQERSALLVQRKQAETLVHQEVCLVELMRGQIRDLRSRYADARRTSIAQPS